MRKKKNVSEDLFFEEHTIHLEIFCFKHSSRFFPAALPPLKKLFYSPTAMKGFIHNIGLDF